MKRLRILKKLLNILYTNENQLYMKRIRIFTLLLLPLFAFTFKSNSQSIEIKAGVNLSTMLAKDEIETYSKDYQMVPRILLGVTTELSLTRLFLFETGLQFSSKGYKIDTFYPVSTYEGEFIPIYEDVTLNYIEIPLFLKMSAQFKKIQFLFTFGPYIGMGLNEKQTVHEYIWEEENYKNKKYRNQMGKDGRWKRFDYGLQAGLGLKIEQMVFKINYGYGLADIAQQDSFTSKNRVLGVTLGYKFEL